MEGYFPLKMKRKDLEDVTDDFSDFSLCSPARKIRRLDAELPPIVEDCEIPMRFEESVPEEQSYYSNLGVLKIEELPIENEERAIVLFKPVNSPLQQLPSKFSVAVDPHIISGIKNQVRQSNESSPWRIANEQVESEDGNSQSNNGCLAVIPWVPSPLLSMHKAEFGQQTDTSDMMEAEATEEATMDVEDDVGVDQENVYVPGAANHLHQWQQQHCNILQLPHNPSTPIVWYRNEDYLWRIELVLLEPNGLRPRFGNDERFKRDRLGLKSCMRKRESSVTKDNSPKPIRSTSFCAGKSSLATFHSLHLRASTLDL